MTERNFTTVVPGFYRMRSGEVAEVVLILDIGPRLTEEYPARGLIGPRQEEWTAAGSVVDDGYESYEDLITFLGVEKPREKRMVKKTVTRWANLYHHGSVTTYVLKAIADDYDQGRIACVEITGEYEVEEDV